MSRTYIQLSRVGDLLNIFPFLYAEYKETGVKPRLMTSREYCSVLDGISYIEPVIFEGKPWELYAAIEQAKANGGQVVCTQVNGPKETILQCTYQPAGQPCAATTSFAKESWRVAGKLHLWDTMPPLVIDQRSPEREAELLARYLPKKPGRKKKLMLVSLGGNSSPFQYRQLLMLVLKFAFDKEYQILELPQCERIYDLLALYERADLLVAADSAPLHLAWACPRLPVFALANDQPMLWTGTPWRPNHHWYCRYSDFPNRAAEMVEAIEALPEFIYDTSLLHVWSEYESHRELQPTGMPFPIKVGMCGRDSQLILQDVKRVPYLKDVIRMAIARAANDGTTIVLSRPDVWLSKKIDQGPPWFSYRITTCGVSEKFSPVTDMFCAQRSFWKEILAEVPDVFLCGDYYWGEALRLVFVNHGAKDATGSSFREETPPKTVIETKTRAHNSELLARFGDVPRYPKVSDQLETLKLETKHMFFCGYNPSVLKTPGGFQMVYRFHKFKGVASTSLALANFDIMGNFQTGGELMSVEKKSLDDPKFFTVSGQTHISWVESNYPHDLKAVVKYGLLKGGNEIIDAKQPNVGKNDWTETEKNWVFWDDKIEGLCCLHKSHPMQNIWSQEFTSCHHVEGPRWAYGEIRGGTPPVEYDGHYLRFFHSSLRNEIGKTPWRYYVGAILTEKLSPFKVVRVSRKPILYGSEVSNVKESDCFHYKRNVVFPNGVMEAKDSWILSSGANDSECVLSIVREKDLNL